MAFVICRCGRRCRRTTYNRKYCGEACRRDAEHAQAQAASAAAWADFWIEFGDVPSAAVADGTTNKLAARFR